MAGIFNIDIFNDDIFNTTPVVSAGGITLSGTHATQALYTGGRLELLIPTEFTFLLKAGIIFKFTETFALTANHLRESLSRVELKLPILVKTRVDYEVNGFIVEKVRGNKFQLKSYCIPCVTLQSEKIKKLLLKKLGEILTNV